MITPVPPDRAERIKTIHDVFISLMWIATRQFSQQLQSFSLTHPQYITLAALVAHGQACTMRELTNVTLQDPPTMTGIVDRLVKMKLVERSRSDSDRRIVLVQATPAGLALVRSIEAEVLKRNLLGYAALTDDDLNVLEQLLHYILRMHVGRFKSLDEADLDAEIERLRSFTRDPISFARSETTAEEEPKA